MNTTTVKKIVKISAGVVTLCALCFFGSILAFYISFRWTDYEKHCSFSTSDGKYDVIIEISYPPFPPNDNLHIKIVCRDNISEQEIEYTKFTFAVPEERNIEWFEFEEISSEKAKLISNSFYAQEIYVFSWQEIF